MWKRPVNWSFWHKKNQKRTQCSSASVPVQMTVQVWCWSSSSHLWSGSAVLAKTASVINSERDKNIRVYRACMCVSVFHMKCLKLWLCTCMTELKKHVLPRLLRPLTLTTPELPAAAAFCLLGLSSCFELLFCFSLFSFSSSSICSAGFVSKLSSFLLSAEYVCKCMHLF